MYALLMTLAALQGVPEPARRVPVPRGADLARLEAEAGRCTATYKDDRCYELQMALGRALIAAGRYRDARDVVEDGRKRVLEVWSPIDDAHSDAIGRAEVRKVRPEQVDPDFPRIAALFRRMWADMAEAHLLRAQAAEAQGDYGDAASGFSAYWSIHTDYVKDPARAARALATGLRGLEAYLTAGDAVQVESIIRFSLPRVPPAFGPDHPLIVGIMVARARAQSALGKYAEAEKSFADARLRAGRTTDEMLKIDADAAYARHLLVVDRLREALEIQRGVVVRLEAAKASPARMAQAYRDFAEVSTGQAALDLAARAVDLHVAVFGADHLLTGRARIAAAGLLDREGYPDQAEQERGAGIAILSKRLPVLHPEVAIAQLRQAENLFMKDRCDEVRSLAGKALDSFLFIAVDTSVAYQDRKHPNAARAQFLLGMCEFRTQPASAIKRLEEAAAIQRAVLTPTHPERLHTEMVLGLIARVKGDYGGSLRLLRTVAAAADERVRSYTSFDAAAQREMKQFSPVYRAIIQTAWVASQPR